MIFCPKEYIYNQLPPLAGIRSSLFSLEDGKVCMVEGLSSAHACGEDVLKILAQAFHSCVVQTRVGIKLLTIEEDCIRTSWTLPLKEERPRHILFHDARVFLIFKTCVSVIYPSDRGPKMDEAPLFIDKTPSSFEFRCSSVVNKTLCFLLYCSVKSVYVFVTSAPNNDNRFKFIPVESGKPLEEERISIIGRLILIQGKDASGEQLILYKDNMLKQFSLENFDACFDAQNIVSRHTRSADQ